MYTLVGLGNPGSEYSKTRHNVGRIIVNTLAENEGVELKERKKPDHVVGTGDIAGSRARVVLPNTYMNKSGSAVSPYVKSAKAATKLVVVYDDIDLPLGVVRVSFARNSGGHNGIKSVERGVKTKEFVRVRVGVSKSARGKAKKPQGEKAVLDFLMGNFTKKEMELVAGPIKERVVVALRALFETGEPEMAMNEVNGLPQIK